LALTEISLEDKSNLITICDGKEIKSSLALLNILSTGKSWYNSKGYFSRNYENELEHNSKILNLTIYELCSMLDYEKYDDMLEVDTVNEYFSRKKRESPDCTFILWQYGFLNKLKTKIIYNVHLTKLFLHETDGGMKHKNKNKNKNKNKTLKTKTTNNKKSYSKPEMLNLPQT